MSKSRLELLKKELLEGDKGNYSTFSVRFSGYSARQLLNEIEFLQKRGESGKVAKKARRRARKTEALARELMEALGGLSYYVTTGEIDTPRFYKDFEVYGDLLDKSKEVLGNE